MNFPAQPIIEKPDVEVATSNSTLAEVIPLCSFNGTPAQYYIGYASIAKSELPRIVGAVSSEMVEKAIVNLLGKGTEAMPWPVVLDLHKKLLYHSFDAHTNEMSAIMGWKAFIAGELK
tara:strand:- start:25986 stop:26339 length:354 start_codon:yes stop_codon:yes gene_type:complete